jgi:hypothetical protein
MRVLLALAVLLVAAACDGGGAEPVETTRLSRSDYVERADAICAEYDRRLARLPQPNSIEDVAELAERALPIAREGVRELRALAPPEELEPQVERWLERNDENLERMEGLRDAALEGNETRVQRIASAATENEREADTLARQIGLRDCARDD